MVSRNDKRKMQNFVTARLEEAKKFKIIKTTEDYIYLQFKPKFDPDKHQMSFYTIEKCLFMNMNI